MVTSKPQLARRAWQKAKNVLAEKFETQVELEQALGISRQALWKWTTVPPHQVPKVSEMTGMPRHELRPDMPDLFPPPPEGTKPE